MLNPSEIERLQILKNQLKYKWEFFARPEQLMPGGNWLYWLILAGRGWGKMSSIYDDIRTKNGWKILADIKDGDIIYDNNGNECVVIKAHTIQTEDAYKLYFDSGETIICCKKHLWYTVSKIEDKRIRRNKSIAGSIKTTQEIVTTLKYKTRETNHRIPICKPVQFKYKQLPIAPYTFGYWLGDGSSNDFVLTIDDSNKEVLSYIQKEGYDIIRRKVANRTPNYAIKKMVNNINHLNVTLKKLKIFKNKHIPFIYQNCSISQRLNLLQGLMDSDGSCLKNGHCEFMVINKSLAYDVFELISGLGIKARMHQGYAKLNGKIICEKYRIRFKTEINVFKLTRKRNAQAKATKKQISRHENRFIIKAELIKNHPMRCLTVDSPDRLFLITKSFIATHNTRTAAEFIRHRVINEDARNLLIVARTPTELREYCIEGKSGILNVFPPEQTPIYQESKSRIIFHNGAEAYCYSAETPDKIRGGGIDTAWFDELATYRYLEKLWESFIFSIREGKPKIIISTTPTPLKFLKDLKNDKDTYFTTGSTYDNAANLSPIFINKILDKYNGTRIGRQEIYAEILDDIFGALWQSSILEQNRIRCDDIAKFCEKLKIIKIGVDPAASSGDSSDETGIIVGGIDNENHGYTLEDASLIGTPNERANVIKHLFYKYGANEVIAEKNNGGDMVEHMIKTVDQNIPVKLVWASRGKFTRAEPVAALDEQHKLSIINQLPQLENELTTWTPKVGKSPNRLDAYVWLWSDLLLESDNFDFGALASW